MYNSDVCYFPNCWAEMGRKLWEDRHFFLCNVVLKWISLGKVCEFFVLKWASLNRSCATILHLIFLTSLKQAVVWARRIMKSNCLRFVTTSCSHLLFPLPRHTLCPSCSVVYSFSIWPSRQRYPLPYCLSSYLFKGLSCICLSCARTTDLCKSSHNWMLFRSLSNLVEREQGGWKLLGLGGLADCLHKLCFLKSQAKK